MSEKKVTPRDKLTEKLLSKRRKTKIAIRDIDKQPLAELLAQGQRMGGSDLLQRLNLKDKAR